MRVLFPGSFDPVTNGHLDLIGRVLSFADSVVVAMAVTPRKRSLLASEERLGLLREACRPWPSVTAEPFAGLVVEAARQLGADLIVRGIRDSAEFSRELRMAQMNRAIAGVETLLLPASPSLAFISSTLVREVASFGGDIAPYVPAAVAERLRALFPRSS